MSYLKDNFIEDGKSKSLSFFLKKNKKALINSRLIEDIKKIAFKKKINLRVCLHTKPSRKFHNMIIFHWRNTYCPPHKHLKKEETCHMIEGSQRIFTFNNKGKILENVFMNTKKNIVFRIDKNIFHSSRIISKYVIFHESKPGPYLGKWDSVYPKWQQSKKFIKFK